MKNEREAARFVVSTCRLSSGFVQRLLQSAAQAKYVNAQHNVFSGSSPSSAMVAVLNIRMLLQHCSYHDAPYCMVPIPLATHWAFTDKAPPVSTGESVEGSTPPWHCTALGGHVALYRGKCVVLGLARGLMPPSKVRTTLMLHGLSQESRTDNDALEVPANLTQVPI